MFRFFHSLYVQICYPEDKFVFKDMDLAPYDLEREMGAYPYAIVRVEYHFNDPQNKGTQLWYLNWKIEYMYLKAHIFFSKPTKCMKKCTKKTNDSERYHIFLSFRKITHFLVIQKDNTFSRQQSKLDKGDILK